MIEFLYKFISFILSICFISSIIQDHVLLSVYSILASLGFYLASIERNKRMSIIKDIKVLN